MRLSWGFEHSALWIVRELGLGGAGGKVVLVVTSTFYFTLVKVFIHLSNSLPTVRGDFFEGVITFIFSITILLGRRGGVAIPGDTMGCLFLHTFFKAINVMYGFCTVKGLILTSTSVLGGVSPFFTVLKDLLVLGRGVDPGGTVVMLTTFVNYLFIVGPAFQGTRFVPSLVNLLNKFKTNVTCAVIHGLNRRGIRNSFVIFFFSTFSALMFLPFVVTRCGPVATLRLNCLLLTNLSTANNRCAVATTCVCTPTHSVSICSCSRVIFSSLLKLFIFNRMPSILDVVNCIVVVTVTTTVFFLGHGSTGDTWHTQLCRGDAKAISMILILF